MNDENAPQGRKVCPVALPVKCPRTMPARFATCKRHWDEAPSHLRKKVVDLYNEGTGARWRDEWPTDEYNAAVKELVEAVERMQLK